MLRPRPSIFVKTYKKDQIRNLLYSWEDEISCRGNEHIEFLFAFSSNWAQHTKQPSKKKYETIHVIFRSLHNDMLFVTERMLNLSLKKKI